MADSIGKLAKEDFSVMLNTSARLTSLLIDKRNEGEATLVKKVAVEFGFVGLAILSLIETIVRGVLGVVVGIPLACLTDNKWAFLFSGGGAVMTAGNTAICVVALLKNFQEAKLDHDEILPCANTFVEGVFGALDGTPLACK